MIALDTAPGFNSLDQPSDTPQARLSYLINKLCRELDADASSASAEAKQLARQAREVVDGYDPYIQRMSSSHPSIIDKMIAEDEKRDWAALYQEGKTQFELIPEMCAGGYEAVVLQQFAELGKVRRVLEIGMFIGTTTVAFAMLPSVERVVSLELEGYLKEINTPFFEEAGVSHKIDVRTGDALSSLEALIAEGASFDMVFIDADKKNYGAYFRRVIEGGLLAKGGFIVADNVAFKGAPWAADPAYADLMPSIDTFNRDVRNYPGIEVVMLPIRDGISLIRRKGE